MDLTELIQEEFFNYDYVAVTDGGSVPNPGRGGWAYVVFDMKRGDILQDGGAREQVTNNEMELIAVHRAFKRIPGEANILLITDSEYVENVVMSWMYKWAGNGWRTRTGEVKNKKVIEKILGVSQYHQIEVQWVKGHSKDGSPYSVLNNYVHDMVTDEIERQTRKVVATEDKIRAAIYELLKRRETN